MRIKSGSLMCIVLLLTTLCLVGPQLAECATVVSVAPGGSFTNIAGFQFSILTPSGTQASSFTPSSVVTNLGWTNMGTGSTVTYVDLNPLPGAPLPSTQSQIGSFSIDVTLGSWVFSNEAGNTISSSTYVVTHTGSNYLVSAVPIPAAAWLLGSGLVGLVALKRRKRS